MLEATLPYPPCPICHNAVPEARAKRRAYFCSKACHKENVRRRWAEQNPTEGLPSGTVGAISELAVAVDLMEKGYEVFRALSPSSTCDLAILAETRLLRIEVRTGSLTTVGKLSFPWQEERDQGRHDILAVRLKTGAITYIPALESLGLVGHRKVKTLPPSVKIEALPKPPAPKEIEVAHGCCPICGEALRRKSRQKYCSDTCRWQAWSKRHPRG